MPPNAAFLIAKRLAVSLQGSQALRPRKDVPLPWLGPQAKKKERAEARSLL
jgi:hypothetical protein